MTCLLPFSVEMAAKSSFLGGFILPVLNLFFVLFSSLVDAIPLVYICRAALSWHLY